MAGIGLSQALGLIAGSPLSKAGTVIAEKLPVTKSMGLNGIGGMLSKVLQNGNLSSIMQNPMAAISGQLQGQITGAISQVTSALGSDGSGIAASLANANGALSSLKSAADNLAGLGSDPQGFFDLVGHGNIAGMLGDAAPSALSFATAAGPITSGTLLAEVETQINAAVQMAVAGNISPEAATALIDAQTARMAAVTAASNNAIAAGQAAAPLLGIASAVGGALAVPSWTNMDPTQTVLATMVQPDAKRAMDAAVQASLGVPPGIHTGSDTALAGLDTTIKTIRGEE